MDSRDYQEGLVKLLKDPERGIDYVFKQYQIVKKWTFDIKREERINLGEVYKKVSDLTDEEICDKEDLQNSVEKVSSTIEVFVDFDQQERSAK